MAKKGFYRQARKRLREDRLGDYSVTQDVVDAIFGNLQTTASGIGRTAQGLNARQTRALRDMAKKAERHSKVGVERRVNRAMNAFGTGFGGVAEQALKPAAAQLGARKRYDATASRVGTAAARTGQDTMAILGKGIEESRAAADYMLAKGLATRASDDEKFVAQMAQDERMARLNAKLQFENWKKQQDYLMKQAEGQNLGALGQFTNAGTVGALMDIQEAATTDGLLTISHDAEGEPVEINVRDVPLDQLVAYLQNQTGLTDPAAIAVLTQAAAAIRRGVPATTALQNAMDQSFSGVQGYNKATANLQETILQAAYLWNNTRGDTLGWEPRGSAPTVSALGDPREYPAEVKVGNRVIKNNAGFVNNDTLR